MKMSDQGTVEKDDGYCCYGIDRAAFNQGVNALFNFSIDYELSAPLVAMGPNAVAVYADTE